MSIPDYETLMLPLLEVAGDGQEHRISDVVDQLSSNFKLTGEERQQLLPSGKQSIFTSRVHWAKTYLVQAGLLEATKRAHFRITLSATSFSISKAIRSSERVDRVREGMNNGSGSA